MNNAFIALGSNLEDPVAHIEQAFKDLAGLASTELLATSSLYQSAPMGPIEQDNYINAVAQLNTRLEPKALLEQLFFIERQHGRQRDGTRWGPRPLDLDLLLYNDLVLNDIDLILPHPGLYLRNFVLYPLSEIAPNYVLPNGQTSTQCRQQIPADGLTLVESSII